MLVMLAILLYQGRGTTFYGDEWDFVLDRSGGGSLAHELLAAHNEHFVLVPVLLYKALFSTVGLHPYWVYRLVSALAHLACVALAWRLVTPRLGSWAGLVAVVPLLFLGTAGENLLWPFQVSLLTSVGFGLGALLALERGTRRGDALASGLVFASLASSALGLSFLVAAAVRLLVAGRSERGRLWVLLGPILLYGLWYVGYWEGSTATRGNLALAPGWTLGAFGAACGSLLGAGLDWGRPLAVVVAGIVGWRLSRPGPLPARLLAYLALGLSFWFLVGLGRPELPQDTSRYLYLGALVVILMLAEVADGRRFPVRVLSVAAAVVAAGAVLNLSSMHARQAPTYRASAADLEPQLAAVELAGVAPGGGNAAKAARLEPNFLTPLRAGPYYEAVRRIGDSPVDPDGLAAAADPTGRAKADRLLIGLGALRIEPDRPGAGVPPRISGQRGGSTEERGGCAIIHSLVPSGSVAIRLVLRRAGIRVRAEGGPTSVRAHRFADALGEAALDRAIPRGEARVLRARPDASPVPWRVELSGSGSLAACSVG